MKTISSITRYCSAGSSIPDRAWVSIDGHPAISTPIEGETEAKLIEWGERYWNNVEQENIREEALRAKYPGAQLFSGWLPARDVEWAGEAEWYIYVLKPRRARGKYQVLAVI